MVTLSNTFHLLHGEAPLQSSCACMKYACYLRSPIVDVTHIRHSALLDKADPVQSNAAAFATKFFLCENRAKSFFPKFLTYFLGYSAVARSVSFKP